MDYLKRKLLSLEELPTQEECLQLRDYLDGKQEFGWTKFCKDQGIYIVVHDMLVSSLIRLLSGLEARTVLEVGAGRGKLSYWLYQKGIPTYPIDNYSWPSMPRFPQVEELDHHQALQKYLPDTVIAGYPDEKTTVPLDIVDSPSVRYFIHLGNSRRGAPWREAFEQRKYITTMDIGQQADTYPAFDDYGGMIRTGNELHIINR